MYNRMVKYVLFFMTSDISTSVLIQRFSSKNIHIFSNFSILKIFFSLKYKEHTWFPFIDIA